MTDRITPEERARRLVGHWRIEHDRYEDPTRRFDTERAIDELTRTIQDAEADVYAQLYAALVDRPTIVTQVVMKVLLAIGGSRKRAR